MATHEAQVAGEKGGSLWLSLPVPADYKGERKAVVMLENPCLISHQQRKKVYVLLTYIADWSGYPVEEIKSLTKAMFLADSEEVLAEEFSLSDCSMTTARHYITWLIDFCIIHDVPIGKDPLLELAEDIPRYVYACLLAKRCCVCGKPSELHHIDSVGAGRNRKEICHIGMRALPLCRLHHVEVHRIGRETFLKKYILEPVTIDAKIARAYRLKA